VGEKLVEGRKNREKADFGCKTESTDVNMGMGFGIGNWQVFVVVVVGTSGGCSRVCITLNMTWQGGGCS
jgi:hypothetical protein